MDSVRQFQDERRTLRERERERETEILAGTSGSKKNYQIIIQDEVAMGYVVELDSTGQSQTDIKNC